MQSLPFFLWPCARPCPFPCAGPLPAARRGVVRAAGSLRTGPGREEQLHRAALCGRRAQQGLRPGPVPILSSPSRVVPRRPTLTRAARCRAAPAVRRCRPPRQRRAARRAGAGPPAAGRATPRRRTCQRRRPGRQPHRVVRRGGLQVRMLRRRPRLRLRRRREASDASGSGGVGALGGERGVSAAARRRLLVRA